MRWLNKNNSARFLIAALLTASCNVYAEALPKQVSLAEYLHFVQNNNLNLQAERTQIDAARADLETASLLPNPSISYTKKPGDKEAIIEQPLPIFGQRGMRMEGAQLGVEAASAKVEAFYASTLRDAAHDFISLLVAQERYQQRLIARTQMKDARRIVLGQVEAGTRSRYDQTRIEIEWANTRMQVAQARTALAAAASRVAATVAAPEWQPVAVGTLNMTHETLTFNALWEQAQTRIPSVRAAIAEQARANKMVDVERREAWPTPAIGVGRVRDRDGNRSIVGISVEIPLFDRRQGQISKARAQSHEMNLRREATILAAQNELRRASEQLQRRRILTERFREDGLKLLPSLNLMAHDAYTLGQGSILELIDSIQSVAEKQIAYFDLLEEVLQAEIDVRFASGQMLPPQL